MAELVVKTKCRSGLRQVADGVLNVTFPIWGLISPITVILLAGQLLMQFQSGSWDSAVHTLIYMSLGLCFSICCLLLKRALNSDFMIVDQQGIKLPRLIGSRINWRSYLGWQDINSIQAIDSEGQSPKIVIIKKKGGSLSIPADKLGADFIEQFSLAARSWAPSVCDSSVDELQNAMRNKAIETNQSSYTALWEEELARRFCPSAYITFEPGRVLRNNTLKVIRHLASGGLSALYLCQLDGNKLVVLKEAVIPDDGPENVKEKAREMFERESQLLMKLDHPGIVHVLDCFTENSRNYMLLEYVNGIDLRQLVKQNGPQKEADVIEWAIQIANALKHLHEREQPIIHRDLTPDNIVLRNDGRIVIVDFGAANEYIGTATGTFVGKHSFIAPEQLRGKATVQSDIYAFGCTLHFLLTAEEPEALSCSNPRTLCPSVSEELAEVVESCTRMEVEDRYQSMAQLLPVLRRLAAQSVSV